MTDSINSRQAGVLCFLLLATLKITSLPSLLYEYNKTGAIFNIIAICVFDALLFCLILWVKSKFPKDDLYAILKRYLGVVITKILYTIFIAFFILKILLLMCEGFGFIRDVVDEEFTLISFLICLMPVICVFVSSGLRNFARTCEFLFPIILIGIFICLLFSFVPIGLAEINSIETNGLSGFVEPMFRLSFWLGDFFALFIILDKIEIKKNNVKKMIIPVLIGFACLIFIYVIYFFLYKETAYFHTNAIYDIVQYALELGNGWNMDIFAIIVYLFSLYLQCGIFLYSAKVCFIKTTSYKGNNVILGMFVFTLISLEFLFLSDYMEYISFTKTYLCYFNLLEIVLIPLFLIFVCLFKGDRKSGPRTKFY